MTVLVVGAPLRHRNRIYNCAVVIHRGRVLGVAPKSYLPTYREFYEGRQIAAGDDERGEIRIADADVPFGPDLLFDADRRPWARAPRRDLRGRLGPDPPELRGGTSRGDRPAQPLRQPDHRRPRRGPQADVPLAVLALPRRLRLRRGGRGRVDDRPLLGRADDDLRERRPARRDASAFPTATGARSPTSTSTCCARSGCGWGRSTTTAARTPSA